MSRKRWVWGSAKISAPAGPTGQSLSKDPAARYRTLQWLMVQVGGIGPMFVQLGFFHKFAGSDYEDKRPCDRYVALSKRLLAVLNQRLATRAWVVGEDYSMADSAIFPCARPFGACTSPAACCCWP